MIDTGSSASFIHKSVAEQLNLYVIPKKGTIPLADSNAKADIIGQVVVDIELNEHKHTSLSIDVIENLFIEVLIGKDILKKHRKVILRFNGTKDELVIGAVPEDDDSQDTSFLA